MTIDCLFRHPKKPLLPRRQPSSNYLNSLLHGNRRMEETADIPRQAGQPGEFV
jgi:hypothetical protein